MMGRGLTFGTPLKGARRMNLRPGGPRPDRIAAAKGIIPVVLRRPLRQVVLGVLAGGVLTWVLSTGTLRDGVWVRTALLAAGYSVLMLGVCLLACIVPTRRVLRVEPTEALRSD